MSEDLNNGDLKQIMIKNNDGIVVASKDQDDNCIAPVSYTHLRAHETRIGISC